MRFFHNNVSRKPPQGCFWIASGLIVCQMSWTSCTMCLFHSELNSPFVYLCTQQQSIDVWWHSRPVNLCTWGVRPGLVSADMDTNSYIVPRISSKLGANTKLAPNACSYCGPTAWNKLPVLLWCDLYTKDHNPLCVLPKELRTSSAWNLQKKQTLSTYVQQ